MATATATHPGKLSEAISFRSRYGNYIGGKWIEPASRTLLRLQVDHFARFPDRTPRILNGRWMRRTLRAKDGGIRARRIGRTS